MKFVSAVVLAVVIAAVNCQQLPNGGKIWAVLVAGSNTYDNYRHQSDVCHAYHVLRNHGVPAEQIITMMYDDIAYNPLNPTPGTIINHVSGPNVYDGVVKDYVGEDVNTENFIKIITGDAAGMAGIGSGKVLRSGPDDHVFINFVDHGSIGLVAFPSEYMYASQLQTALQTMSDKNLYGELTFYLEACEAGSMFVGFPDNIHIYVATASNAVESSYACYWSVEYQAYLGDLFSVNWMENSDDTDLTVESLQTQFDEVKVLTTESHAMQYGDLTFQSEIVGDFLGTSAPAAKGEAPKPKTDAVPAPDVPLWVLRNKMAAAESETEKVQLRQNISQLIANRKSLRRSIVDIVGNSVKNKKDIGKALNGKLTLVNRACYESVVEHFSQKCYPLAQNTYAMRQLQVFVNLCEMGVSIVVTKSAIEATCDQPILGVV